MIGQLKARVLRAEARLLAAHEPPIAILWAENWREDAERLSVADALTRAQQLREEGFRTLVIHYTSEWRAGVLSPADRRRGARVPTAER